MGTQTEPPSAIRADVEFQAELGKQVIHNTEVTFRNPVLLGLFVCSHKADVSDTVVFSDVSVEQAPARKIHTEEKRRRDEPGVRMRWTWRRRRLGGRCG